MPKPKPAKTYRQLQAELTEIIAWFESGEPQVDEVLAKYEQANALIAEIKKYLDSAENSLRKINAKLE